MQRYVLVWAVALALAVAGAAQASTIQLGIRSGTPWTLGGMNGPPLCGVPGSDTNATRVACVGASSVIITQGSTLAGAVDTNDLTTAITWSGTIGLWDVVVTGTGFDERGLPTMDLDISVTTPRGKPLDTLEIYFSLIGNPPAFPSPVFDMDLEGTAQAGTVRFAVGMCNMNMTNFMTATSFGQRGPFGSGPFDSSWYSGPPQGAVQNHTYSVTQRFQIHANAEGSSEFSGTATLQPVPEPASLLLLGTGLAGLIAARRRR